MHNVSVNIAITVQNGHHTADIICNTLYFRILIQLKLKLIPRCSIHNMSALIEVMAGTEQETSYSINQ